MKTTLQPSPPSPTLNPLPIRVLLVSSKYPPEYSGSGLRAHRTYKRLSTKYPIEFDVLTSSVTSNESCTYDYEGIQVTRIANKASYRLRSRKSLRAFTTLMIRGMRCLLGSDINYWTECLPTIKFLLGNHKKYQLLHIFGRNYVTYTAMTFAKVVHKPSIVELVNLETTSPEPNAPPIIRKLVGTRHHRGTKIVAISKALKEVCIRSNYTEKDIWCRPNPVDETHFYFSNDRLQEHYETRREFGFASSDILCISIAKFMPLKNQEFIVKVMKRLPSHYKLILAGPRITAGPLLERDESFFRKVEALIISLGLEARVKLIPKFIDEPHKFMKASNIYLIPSISEGLSTPLLEALACGLPVITNDIPGVFDTWIDNGVNGFICPLDEQLWAKKIPLAVNLDPQNLRKSAEKIMKVASTQVIDSYYFDLLQSQVTYHCN